MQPGRAIFRGRIFDVVAYDVLAEGRPIHREMVEHPGAAAILPIDGDGMVIMVNQYRFPAGRLLEIPAGTMEKNESPLQCAHRELREETGYVAGRMEPLLSYHPSIGYSTEVIHCFVATNLTESGASPDEDEIISVQRYSPPQVLEMIKSGAIRDSKTMCCMLAYRL